MWSVRGLGYPVTGLSCNWVILLMGYPVTRLSNWGWYNQSDWGDGVVRRVEVVGDGDNLGYTCNLLEHE